MYLVTIKEIIHRRKCTELALHFLDMGVPRTSEIFNNGEHGIHIIELTSYTSKCRILIILTDEDQRVKDLSLKLICLH